MGHRPLRDEADANLQMDRLRKRIEMLERRYVEGVAVFEIKVFEDDKPNIAKARAFVWEIPHDLDGASIVEAGAFVTTAGGLNEISITLVGGGDVLDDTIIVDAGELSSHTGRTPSANFQLAWGDQLEINTLSASGQGLGVWVALTPAAIASGLVKGAKGDPGGVTNWTGEHASTPSTAWVTSHAYNVGDIVEH